MKIEFILRESTTRDILKPWMDSGHMDNSGDGGFVFEDVTDHSISLGIITIETECETYFYNISDFYRIKIDYND